MPANLGRRRYRAWVAFLLLGCAAGALTYFYQLDRGLAVTGLSRGVAWGLYIAQFTFLVGVAASMAVVPVLARLDPRRFGKISLPANLLAAAACITALLFVFADLGRPFRALNLILHAAPGSTMFYDMLLLNGFLALNLLLGWTALGAEERQSPGPRWVGPVIYLSIAWAVALRAVSSLVFAGLGLDAGMVALFLARGFASALASGPALLALALLAVRGFSGWSKSDRALEALARISAWSLFANLLLIGLEALIGNSGAPFMRASIGFTVPAFVLLAVPALRQKPALLAAGLIAAAVACFLDKGLGLTLSGQAGWSPAAAPAYLPRLPEYLVSAGAWSAGALLLTLMFQRVAEARREPAPAAAGRGDEGPKLFAGKPS